MRAKIPAALRAKLAKTHGGSEVDRKLRADPYGVLRAAGASLEAADKVAASLGLPGHRRAEGHAVYLLGDGVLSSAMLASKLRFSLGVPEATARSLMAGWQRRGVLVEGEGAVVTAAYHETLLKVAREVLRRGREAPARPAFAVPEGLSPDQAAAATVIATRRMCVITGGPGTGKSALVRAVLDACPDARVTAPTGRAARNAFGKTIHHFKTIQEATGKDLGEARVVIVDEASMVSTKLLEAVLDLAPRDAHVVLVGDVDQLPPIDEGDALRDVIASGAVPVHTLRHNFRSDAGVQALAAAVLAGRLPATLPAAADVVACESLAEVINAAAACSDDMILTPHNLTRVQINAAVQLRRWAEAGGMGVLDAADRVCVATMRDDDVFVGERRVGSVAEAVEALRAYPGAGVVSYEKCVLRRGDRVIVTRNGETACNGDVGVLASVEAEHVDVDVTLAQGAPVRVALESTGGEVDDLTLAYCVTVHKAQGSEFPAVVLPVWSPRMWSRTMLYTAVTRAQHRVVFLGSRSALDEIVGSEDRPRAPSALFRYLRAAVATCKTAE